ncbi:MAG: lipid-A-disaccharide synthase [Bacteroidales bacterium]|nr:lipid-A-disaccharide synthase [Bacteroidales bacterium]MBO6238525.1 lipid-A-disaccharide synthase [Bacteroidales bacterium]
MRYFLIAGEASGDLHGSNLVKGLLAEDPAAECRCWGGDLMQAAGAQLLHHYREGAVMGITDILRSAGKLLRNLRTCKADIASWQPDVVILIDYPGFNMKIAKWCHARGIRVFYYIAPKTWASREGRNRKLKAWVDRLFIVFPFEIPYFTQQGIPFIYKGNPLVDAVDGHAFVRPAEGRYIAMLAGSRKEEIGRMMPVCMAVADRLSALPGWEDVRFVVAGAPARSEADYLPFMAGRTNVELVFGRTYDVLKYAGAAVINSGTASLEAALIGTPQVVCWSTSPVSAWVARHILHVLDHIRFISLGNLCLDRLAFRELIQEEFTPEAVASEIRRLVEDGAYRQRMLSDYADIRQSLGGSGASRAVAGAMIEELNKR